MSLDIEHLRTWIGRSEVTHDVATAARTDANVTADLSVTAEFAADLSGQVILDETTSTTTGTSPQRASGSPTTAHSAKPCRVTSWFSISAG